MDDRELDVRLALIEANIGAPLVKRVKLYGRLLCLGDLVMDTKRRWPVRARAYIEAVSPDGWCTLAKRQ